MAAICTMPLKAFETSIQPANIVSQRVVGENVVTTELFSGASKRAIQASMDARASELESAGGQMLHRTKIGRNAPCPCGSGLKLKKCCLGKATIA